MNCPMHLGNSAQGTNTGLNTPLAAQLSSLRMSSTARYGAPFTPRETLVKDTKTLAFWDFNDCQGAGTSSLDAVVGLPMALRSTTSCLASGPGSN